MTGPAHANPALGVSAPSLPLLDRILFYVLLAALCARPIISETFEPGQISFLTALQVAGGPTPATTAALDTLLLAAAACTLARRQRWRAAPVFAIGIGLLMIAVLLSTAAADDKPIALLAGSDLVAVILAGAALAALVRTRWMLHLMLAAFLATGAAAAVKCVNQHIFENPQTQERWEQVYKPELIRQGMDPQDPLFINFERRMRAGESYGFLGHPNVTASCLLIWLLSAAGLLGGHCLRRPPPAGPRDAGAPLSPRAMHILRLVAAVVLVGLLAVAVVWTGSRGAMVSAAIGIPGVAFFGRAAAWVARHTRVVLALVLIGYFGFIAGLIGYGLHQGTLPTPSLAFRWYYWTAAGRALGDAPLTGLGRENFGPAYMRYKVAESTEEVRNPHGLWVSFLVELGPLGLLAAVLLCARCLWGALRSLAPAPPAAPAAEPLTPAHVVPAAALFLLVHALFSGLAFGEPGVALVWGQDIAFTWLLALAVATWLLAGLIPDTRGSVWLAAGLCAALLAVLLHSVIDFALLTPGGLSVFVLAGAAAALLVRNPNALPVQQQPRALWSRTAAAVVGALLVAGHLLAVTVPARATARALQRLDTSLHALRAGNDPTAVAADAAALVQSNRRDPSAASAAARGLCQVGRLPGLPDDQRHHWLEQARADAAEACRRGPANTTNYATLAAIDEELARVDMHAGAAERARVNLRSAADNWDHAVELYPTNPRAQISAGRAWFEIWRDTQSPDAASRARAHFLAALRIDDTRPAQEVVRLRPAERTEIESLLQRLTPAP